MRPIHWVFSQRASVRMTSSAEKVGLGRVSFNSREGAVSSVFRWGGGAHSL